MSIYVINYGDGTFQTSAEDFPTLGEAQQWQMDVFAHNGRAGTLQTQADFELSVEGQIVVTDVAKQDKLIQLIIEANSRFPPPILGIINVKTINAMAQVLSGDGDFAVLVVVAFDGAVVDINALTTQAAVDAYNVVTDPSWP